MDALRLPQDPKSLVKDQLVNPAPRGRNWRATRLLPVALGLLLLAASWAPAMADDAFDLINELMCPSDCVETLAICQMTEAAQMRTLIKQEVAAGWSKEKIVDGLVAQYGERILAAPTKQGFNLTAWLTPFAAILGGGVFISVLVANWVRRRRAYDSFVKARMAEPAAGDLDSYKARLAAELRDFE